MLAVGLLSGLMVACVAAGDLIHPAVQIWIYAFCIQWILGILIQWNLCKGPGARGWRIAWASTSVLLAAFMFWILILDRTGLEERSGPPAPERLVGGMEPATAAMMIGVNLLSYVYVFLWGAGFHRAIFPRRSIERIRALSQDDGPA